MPAAIALAATWNPDLAQREGEVIGQEARKRGKDIMLGPGLNIMRTPLCGRNFEYLGEDPFLASRMAVGYIRGVQSRGVASCAKHLAVNNQEHERGTINVEVDERALREIYLPAFKAAVQEAGVWSVMGAYNRFRGQHCCENDYLLNQILKTEWGFQGLVVSDWAGTHSTRGAALSGLDLEMGTEKAYRDFYLADAFVDGLRKGDFPMSALDDKVRRNLRVMIATHVLDERSPGSINTREHQAIARRVAEEAIVLLKNEGGFLPLHPDRVKTLAVIGENAVRLQAYGGDSSRIKAFYEVPPLEGILRRVGHAANVIYSEGYRKGGDSSLATRAEQAAAAADAVIYIGGLNHDPGYDSEGADRKDMKLPYGQSQLIQRIVKANPRTAVVLVGGSPMEMDPWLSQVPAVVLSWYSGMEGGNAIAGVLFGDVNPSGKLPCTFPRRLDDSPAHALHAYPGKNGTVRYEEGLLVGYRWFDTRTIEPLFPFGHGLSFTTFKYSNLALVNPATNGPAVIVQFEIANTGRREGAETAQVYVHHPQSRLTRPLKELKGFSKVNLKPGAKQVVSIPLNRSAFAFYDPDKRAWCAEAGEYKILVGSSSRDLRLDGTFKLGETIIEK
jgi:beta-glucosidase